MHIYNYFMPDGSNYSPDNSPRINRRKFIIGAAATGITAAIGGAPLLNEYARSNERPLDPFEYIPELAGVIDALQQGNNYRQILDEKDSANLFADIIEFNAREDIEKWQINDVSVHHSNPSVVFHDNEADFTVDMSISARAIEGIKMLLENAGLSYLQDTLKNTAEATYTSSAHYRNKDGVSPFDNLTYKYIVDSPQTKEDFENKVVEKEVGQIERTLLEGAEMINGPRLTSSPDNLFSCVQPTLSITHIGNLAVAKAGIQDYVVEMEIKGNRLEIVHTTKSLKEKQHLKEEMPRTP